MRARALKFQARSWAISRFCASRAVMRARAVVREVRSFAISSRSAAAAPPKTNVGAVEAVTTYLSDAGIIDDAVCVPDEVVVEAFRWPNRRRNHAFSALARVMGDARRDARKRQKTTPMRIGEGAFGKPAVPKSANWWVSSLPGLEETRLIAVMLVRLAARGGIDETTIGVAARFGWAGRIHIGGATPSGIADQRTAQRPARKTWRAKDMMSAKEGMLTSNMWVMSCGCEL